MQSIKGRFWPLALMLSLLLAGCGGSTAAPMAPAARQAAAPTTAAAMESSAAEATSAPAAPEDPAGVAEGSSPAVQIVNDPTRKIIKDATFILEVQNVAIALTQIGNIAAQSGGYVLETNTAADPNTRQTGLIKIAVPVDQFEAALQHVRETSITIISEQASGQDVTQEFVDTQSQIANLEATQARIREFLNQAKTIEESLKVNAQLTEIEGQISQLKGRSQFLAGRAAYSTITAQLQLPPPPPVTPTPEPSPTPTPEPVARVEPTWSAGETASSASNVLVAIARVIATVGIWLTVVAGPFLAPAILVWLMLRGARRRARARMLANSAQPDQP
jgi:hypothetical protein